MHRLGLPRVHRDEAELPPDQRPPEQEQAEPVRDDAEEDARELRDELLEPPHAAPQDLDPGEVPREAVVVEHRLHVEHVRVSLHHLPDSVDGAVQRGPRRVEQRVGLAEGLGVVVLIERLVMRQTGGVRLVPAVHSDVVDVRVHHQVRLREGFAHDDLFSDLGLADVDAVFHVHRVVVGHPAFRVVLGEELLAAHVLELVVADEPVQRDGAHELDVALVDALLDAPPLGLLEDDLANVGRAHRRERDADVVERHEDLRSLLLRHQLSDLLAQRGLTDRVVQRLLDHRRHRRPVARGVRADAGVRHARARGELLHAHRLAELHEHLLAGLGGEHLGGMEVPRGGRGGRGSAGRGGKIAGVRVVERGSVQSGRAARARRADAPSGGGGGEGAHGGDERHGTSLLPSRDRDAPRRAAPGRPRATRRRGERPRGGEHHQRRTRGKDEERRSRVPGECGREGRAMPFQKERPASCRCFGFGIGFICDFASLTSEIFRLVPNRIFPNRSVVRPLRSPLGRAVPWSDEKLTPSRVQPAHHRRVYFARRRRGARGRSRRARLAPPPRARVASRLHARPRRPRRGPIARARVGRPRLLRPRGARGVASGGRGRAGGRRARGGCRRTARAGALLEASRGVRHHQVPHAPRRAPRLLRRVELPRVRLAGRGDERRGHRGGRAVRGAAQDAPRRARRRLERLRLHAVRAHGRGRQRPRPGRLPPPPLEAPDVRRRAEDPAPAAERSRADATRSSSREEDASPPSASSSSSRRSPHLPEWDDRSLTGGERRAARRTPEAPAADARDASLEIDYVSVINRALPDDVRVLAWSYVDASFSARFDCSYRHYKYFFADPGGGGLDLDAMRDAARRLEGEHDFRNLCKMDAKNVHNYVRRVDSCRVYAEGEESDEERSDDDDAEEAGMNGLGFWGEENRRSARFRDRPRGATSLCHISIKGTAFLWHQVRCVAALLFLVGLGREDPSVVDALLDLRRTPRKPQFEMAPEEPLLLWRVGHEPGTRAVDRERRREGAARGARREARAETRRAARALDAGVDAPRARRVGLPADRLAASATLSVTASSRSAAPHVRLAERATEPTYEERREQLRERGGGKARAANAYRATVESFVRDEGLGGTGGRGRTSDSFGDSGAGGGRRVFFRVEVETRSTCLSHSALYTRRSAGLIMPASPPNALSLF